MSLYSKVEDAPCDFVASRVQSRVLQYPILKDSEIYDVNSNFNRTLDYLSGTLSDFDLSSFTRNNHRPLKTHQVLTSSLFDKHVHDMKVKYDITTRQKIIFCCYLQAAHAHDFLQTISVDSLDHYMSSEKCHTIIRYHLMIILFHVDEVFHICRKTCLDTFCKHNSL